MNYNKEQIKEIILTDYLDGRLDETAKKEIDTVISQDVELTEFLNAVMKSAQEPFNNIQDAQPPEHVWQNIKEQIEGSQTPSILEDFLDRIKILWARPRLSFALGSVATVLIVFLWVGTSQFRNTPVPYNSEHVENLIFLAGGDIVDPEDISNGFGTSIEEYFL